MRLGAPGRGPSPLRVPERAPVRLALYAALLGAVLVAALGAGRTVGPIGADAAPPSEHGASSPARGLAAAEAGHALVVDDPVLTAGTSERLRFRIVGPDGRTVRAFDRVHGKELHLIVVRRDLSGYRHVHPVRAADGTWETTVRLDEAGVYRAYADIRPASGPALTLAADLTVAGELRPRPLPAPAATARVGDHEVAVHGRPTAGRATTLTFSVSRRGAPVTDLEPYLEARGHLVALRAADLAYLHVHAEGDGGAGPDLRFTVTFPAPGRHRLFLDFRHDDVVRTAALTVDVPAGAGGAPDGGHGHGG